jgi:DNA invertase Pin-like site-specific DNA recombinase
MKAAIYTRVSTDKQKPRQPAKRAEGALPPPGGWAEVTEYADVVSGAKFSRQGLDRLMADVRRGKLDVGLCFKLDRLSRSLPHLGPCSLPPKWVGIRMRYYRPV